MNWSQYHEDYMKPQNVKVVKNPHFILKEDGLYMTDLPEEPNRNDYGGTQSETDFFCKIYLNWCNQKDQAIKDAVKLKDQELGVSLIKLANPTSSQISLVKNNPYKVDLSGYDVTFEDNFICSGVGDPLEQKWCLTKQANECTCKAVKFTILIPILPPKKDGSLCGNFPRVSKERIDGYQPNNTVDTNNPPRQENSAHSFTEIGSNEWNKAIDPEGYVIAAAKILDALKLVIGEDVNEHAMPVIVQIMKNNIQQPSVTEESQEELWLEARTFMKVVHPNGIGRIAMDSKELFENFTITRKPKKV